jgi:serine phosphatase RsbU (regulator of sigma subunit)
MIDPSEIKLAGDVQKLLLPKQLPHCNWCFMAAKNRMAEVLGGDFYDFIELDNGHHILFIGDITGHGLHASVVMSLVYGFIHRAACEECLPQDVVADLNRFLRSFARRSNRLDHFFSATLFFGIIDPHNLTMSYVNAGHPAGLVKRRNGLLRLPATSHPVGYFDEGEFPAVLFQLEEGDRLLLYTDGLIDSPTPRGELYGSERLAEAFCRLQGDHGEFLELLFAELGEHLAGHVAFDDCTAIVVDLLHAVEGGDL